jgi:DNA (cytosine-5)-methyltransferase 1
MKIGALFAGIGGLDLGFQRLGHEIIFASDIDPIAQLVLREHLPGAKILGDITQIKKIPKVDVLTGGFPCQDISLAGTRLGLLGKRSGLVNEVLRLVEQGKPEFVVLENVLNLLRIEKGAALISILSDFEQLGYKWAYRVVDTRGFGLPQRRMRVVILASRGKRLPGEILFSANTESVVDDAISPLQISNDYGFYWTEGKRGIGWATNSVPTIKGGSGLGIPSAPAVFSGIHKIAGTIDIRDAERLQGFPADWTALEGVGKVGNRWRLVGNAVSAPVSDWIASALEKTSESSNVFGTPIEKVAPLPHAAFNHGDGWQKIDSSTHITHETHVPLRDFLNFPLQALSPRALTGYLKRVDEGDKKFPEGFVEALRTQLHSSGDERLPNFDLN